MVLYFGVVCYLVVDIGYILCFYVIDVFLILVFLIYLDCFLILVFWLIIYCNIVFILIVLKLSFNFVFEVLRIFLGFD